MVTLPAAGYIENDARTQGEGKQFLEDLRQFLEDRFGKDSGILARSKNALINGNFDLWQRGVSVTTTTGGAYIADRWRHELVGASGSITVSRQAFTLGQTEVPGEPPYYYRANQTAAPATGTTAAEQRIESVRSFAGQDITVSFYAKADAAQTFELEAAQNFGTGGSPSAEVALTQNIALTTSWALYTATFALASIINKALGTGGNDYLGIRLNSTVGTNSTFTLDLARIQVEPGTGATPFDQRTPDEEVLRAQRFYEKSYDLDTAPGTATNVGAIGYNVPIGGGGVGAHSIVVNFTAPKRAAPTVVSYNPIGTGTTWRNITAAANSGAVTRPLGGNWGQVFTNTQVSGDSAGHVIAVHYTADAEL